MKITVCDRCKEEIYRPETYWGSSRITIVTSFHNGDGTHTYDLCEPCTKYAKEWLMPE